MELLNLQKFIKLLTRYKALCSEMLFRNFYCDRMFKTQLKLEKLFSLKDLRQFIIYQRFMPACKATVTTLDLSTKPGPDEIFVPGNIPAFVFQR